MVIEKTGTEEVDPEAWFFLLGRDTPLMQRFGQLLWLMNIPHASATAGGVPVNRSNEYRADYPQDEGLIGRYLVYVGCSVPQLRPDGCVRLRDLRKVNFNSSSGKEWLLQQLVSFEAERSQVEPQSTN